MPGCPCAHGRARVCVSYLCVRGSVLTCACTYARACARVCVCVCAVLTITLEHSGLKVGSRWPRLLRKRSLVFTHVLEDTVNTCSLCLHFVSTFISQRANSRRTLRNRARLCNRRAIVEQSSCNSPMHAIRCAAVVKRSMDAVIRRIVVHGKNLTLFVLSEKTQSAFGAMFDRILVQLPISGDFWRSFSQPRDDACRRLLVGSLYMRSCNSLRRTFALSRPSDVHGST